MNKIFFYPLFLLTFLLSQTACTQMNSQKQSVKEGTLLLDTISNSKKSHLFDDENFPYCSVACELIYPIQHENSIVLKKMQTFIVEKTLGSSYANYPIKKAVSRYLDDYVIEYKELESEIDKENYEEAFAYTYNCFKNVHVLFNEENIFSFYIEDYQYTGGAHGLTLINKYNLDMKTGNLIDLDAVFLPNAKEALRPLLIKTLMDNNDLSIEEGMRVFYLDNVQLIDNFSISDKGITFTYGLYEIAAYVYGIIDIFLPYEDIKDYLKEDSLVFKFANK